MPDLKISQLPVASATTGAELFPVVQGGVTKQIALNAVRHIGSAVFDANGSMAVDTNTLFVDAVNNRVGVGTVTPAGVFHALTTGNTNVYLETTAAAARAGTIYQRSGVIKYYAGLGAWTGNDTYEIATATGLAVTVDTSGNLGLGVTPSAWASAAAGYSVMQIRNAAFYGISTNIARMSANAFVDGSGVNNYISNGFATRHDQVDGEFRWLTAPSGTAGTAISFTQAMTLNASGNLGLGVTPSAWNSDFKVVQIGANGSVAGRVGTSNTLDISSNAFRDAGGTWTYITTSAVSRLTVDGSIGGFQFYTAPSGTAGNAISFTQAMTLSASSNLTIGGTTESARVRIEGTTNLSTALQLFRSGNSCGAIWQEASAMRFGTDGSTGFTEKLRVDATTTAGQTALLLWDVDNGTMERVTVGAADSGGTGFKVLRIPN